MADKDILALNDAIKQRTGILPDRDPNLTYLDYLPIAFDPKTGELFFAYPETVRELVSAFETPARVARGEITDLEQAARDVAFNVAPAGGIAGLATVPKGTVLAMGAGKGLSGLLPERWYRGTNNPKELDYQYTQGTEGVLGGGGVYLTPDPTYASRYAEESVLGEPKKGGFVLPLMAKFDKPLIVELNKEKGEFAEGRVLQELLGISQEKAYDKAEKALDRKGSLTNEVKQKAIQQGYDGVVLVQDGKVLEAISYRPEDIRSVFGEGSQALDDILDNLNFTPEIDAETFFKKQQTTSSVVKPVTSNLTTPTELPFPTTKDIWWKDELRDTGKVTMYHGAAKENLDSILTSGLKTDRQGFSYLTPDPDTGIGYAVMSGQGGEKAFKGAKKVKDTPVEDRVLLQIEIPEEAILNNLNKQRSPTSKKKLLEETGENFSPYVRSDLGKGKLTEPYYSLTEFRLNQDIPPEWIKGYSIKTPRVKKSSGGSVVSRDPYRRQPRTI